MNNEILQQLNDSQRDAVLYCDGASLVIAGAGSGKTRVLTYKIAWLLEQGMKSYCNEVGVNNYMRLKISEVLMPPNAKLFDIKYSVSSSRPSPVM